MENTRIYKILTSLDRPMLNRFVKFIHSPYHNVNDNVTRIVEVLEESIKNQEAIGTKDAIWDLLNQPQQYNDSKFRKLCNDVLQKFEEFLVIETLSKKKLSRTNFLLTSLKQFRFPKLTQKNIARGRKAFEREVDRSSDYYYELYTFEKIIHNLKSNYEKKTNIKSFFGELSFTELEKNLDVFYVIEKLRVACDEIAWTKMYNTKSSIDISDTLEAISKKQLFTIKSVDVYWKMYEILSEPDNYNSYFQLNDLASKHINDFPQDEQREILDALIGFCVNQVNKDNSDFLVEMLNLYDWGIKQQIMLTNGYISPTSYRNYVVVGLRANELDRVEKFIYEKGLLLEENKRENAINFNLARVNIYKKKYDDVITFLTKVNYDDVWYNLNSRIYLLVSYYELDEYMAMESQLESLLTFLRREKSVQDSVKVLFSNFAKYLKKIYRAEHKDPKALSRIKSELVDEKNVINKSWLLEKIDELL